VLKIGIRGCNTAVPPAAVHLSAELAHLGSPGVDRQALGLAVDGLDLLGDGESTHRRHPPGFYTPFGVMWVGDPYAVGVAC